MANVRKPLDWLAANALSGAIWRYQLWMGRFEISQLRKQLVVLTVADPRRRVDIVTPIVLANFLA
jgi:hypothetical protein